MNEKAVMADTMAITAFFSMAAFSLIAPKGAERRDFVRFYIAIVERSCAPEIPAG
jgi:hypothetical protein